ncbi:RNA-directed DNA polymerase, eukaryota, reverse transcriptase zinc-binding domain protein [Tanacetum coccineum]
MDKMEEVHGKQEVRGPRDRYHGVLYDDCDRLKPKRSLDLLSFCSRSIGNGVETKFWTDLWHGDKPLKAQFHHIFLLDSDRDCSVENRIIVPNWLTVLRRCLRGGVESSQFEALQAWKWSLDVSAGFSVAFVRHLVDSRLLVVDQIATRWNRCVPIKVNVFLWRLSLNKLPSRVNLDRKCIDVGSVLCPICQDDVESVNHISFSFRDAKFLGIYWLDGGLRHPGLRQHIGVVFLLILCMILKGAQFLHGSEVRSYGLFGTSEIDWFFLVLPQKRRCFGIRLFRNLSYGFHLEILNLSLVG